MVIGFYLIFFYLSGLPLNKVGPPRLETESSTLVISQNNTLQLSCHGGFRLDWIYPYEIERTRISVEQEHCSACSPKRHRSVLTIASADVGDTGKYQCLYKKYDMKINNETSAKVYVYISSPGKLKSRFIIVYPYPCPPTKKNTSEILECKIF